MYYAVSEWTTNKKEHSIGGLQIGELAMAVTDKLQDALFYFIQATEQSACDGQEVETIVSEIEQNWPDSDLGEDDQGCTIDNDEGHYINIRQLVL